jgi:hypothetical protein
MITSTHVPPSPCPGCGTEMDGATGPGSPQPGDLAICVRCLHISAYGWDLALNSVTDTDILNHPQIVATVAAMRLWKATR